MIHVEVKGGLGNQLFMYAFARAQQLDTGESIRMYDVHTSTAKKAAITVSTIVPSEVDIQYLRCSDRSFWKQIPFRSFIFRASRRLYMMLRSNQVTPAQIERTMQPFWSHLGIYHITDGFFPLSRSRLFRDFYCSGYFQSARYFGTHAEEIRSELCRSDLISAKNADFLRQIQTKNTVCIHIRLGDYVRDPAARRRYYICDEAYYQAAIQQACAELKNPVFVVFSNDYQQVRDTVTFPENAEILFSSPDNSAVDDLQLMAQCKHYIIANSSFSWWAQFLSPNPEKKVYAPAMWVRDGIPVDLYDPRWTTIHSPLPKID